jgi:hypothetical protein
MSFPNVVASSQGSYLSRISKSNTRRRQARKIYGKIISATLAPNAYMSFSAKFRFLAAHQLLAGEPFRDQHNFPDCTFLSA